MLKQLLNFFKKETTDKIDKEYQDLITNVPTVVINKVLSYEITNEPFHVYEYLKDLLPNEFIPYVVGSPVELMSYLEGKALSLSAGVDTHKASLLSIANELGEDLVQKSETLVSLLTALQEGYLHIFSDFYDVVFASTFYNGILPDGTEIDLPITSQNDYIKYKNIILKHLAVSDNVPKVLTESHLNLKKLESYNAFNVTCDKCSTPHNFKNSPPQENFYCSLCGKPLVIYTFLYHTEKE